MYDADADVHVRKIVEDRSDVEVRLRVRSERDGPTRVSFVEHLPERLPVGALTFGSTRWSVDDEAGNRLRWTDTVHGDAVAAYGLCLPTDLDGNAFCTAPSIETVDELEPRPGDPSTDAAARFGEVSEETAALDLAATPAAECNDRFGAFTDTEAFGDLVPD